MSYVVLGSNSLLLPTGRVRQDSHLNKDQREQKLSVLPGVLEYFSYQFNFHSFLAGPSCGMKDFQAFMDGSNFKVAPSSVSCGCGVLWV